METWITRVNPESIFTPRTRTDEELVRSFKLIRRWGCWGSLLIAWARSSQLSSVFVGLSLSRRWLLHWTMSSRHASQTYASQAWYGMLDASGMARLESTLQKAIKQGFLQQNHKKICRNLRWGGSTTVQGRTDEPASHPTSSSATCKVRVPLKTSTTGS